jgi:hypothetical protein
MSEIHYFQRYSSKENAVTNSTLHLFTRIYEHSTSRLKDLLNKVFEADIPLGVAIRQQTVSTDSVPDGSISQAPVRIVIETKVDAAIDVGQLKRHLSAFSNGAENYLLLLTRSPMGERESKEVAEEAKKHHVQFTHATFEHLCSHLKPCVHDFETDLKAIIDDFVDYCYETGLLPDRRVLMRVVPCGDTYALNRQYGLYYNPIYRGLITEPYLGVYWRKAVRLIGKIEYVCDATLTASGLTKTPVNGVETAAIDARIAGIINDTKSKIGWDVSSGHRFFSVGRFVETEYKKTSLHGIQGPRIRDISDAANEADNLEKIAERLRQLTWQ